MRTRTLTVTTLLGVVFLVSIATPTQAAPPTYPSFGREQRLDYTPKPEDLMRIWLVFINQGDGIILQLPTKYRSVATPGHPAERIDVMIDGGANPAGDPPGGGAHLITEFFKSLYPHSEPTMEYGVITHHDEDHVAGVTYLLGETKIPLPHLFHNGLASYRRGKRNFPASGNPSSPAVFKGARGMAFMQPDKVTFQPSYLIPDLATLLQRQSADEFHGTYAALADSIVAAKEAGRIQSFDRAIPGVPFINEMQAAGGAPLPGLTFEVVWPLKDAEAYESRDWAKTINGNSVTLKLTYGDFEMLFTGDQNSASETRFLDNLKATSRLAVLSCDILKVPHHGSDDGLEEFFTHPNMKPVVSVASMGEEGFESKAMKGNGAWQHPSTKIIEWLGGPQRFYSTFIHEKRFDWNMIKTEADRQAMIEIRHILIETDGQWFRLVEVPVGASDYTTPPDVSKVKRSDGTQWIRAR